MVRFWVAASYFGLGVALFLLVVGIRERDFFNGFLGMYFLFNSGWRLYGGRRLNSGLGKPLLQVSPDGIHSVAPYGSFELPLSEIDTVLGGGDNLRIQRRDGSVVAFDMMPLSEPDRIAALEAARDLVQGESRTTELEASAGD